MSDLLLNQLGITETKIGILDILIKLAKKQDGMIELEDLEEIKRGLIRGAKEGELNEVFNSLNLNGKENSQ